MGGVKRPVWSYRVLKQQHEGGKGEEAWVEMEYGIVEAYFDEDGKPVGYCDPQMFGNSVEELRSVLGMMHNALDKPVMETGDFKAEHERTVVGGAKSNDKLRDLKNSPHRRRS